MNRSLARLGLPWLVLSLAGQAFCEKNVNGVPVLTTLAEYADPKHTAVLVVDMQNEIVSTEGGYSRKDRKAAARPEAHQVTPAYKKLVASISAFLDQARAQRIPVIYAEYIHRDENGKMLVNGTECWTHRKADWVSCAVAGTWESKTIRELAPRPGELVIRKGRANAFHNTYLDDVLKEKSIRSILLVGTAGGGCVFATAMGALDRGYYAVFVKDCVTQQEYLDSDLIRGRFPIFSAHDIRSVWPARADKRARPPSPAGKVPVNASGANVDALSADPAYVQCVLELLRERLYAKAELDEWLRPKPSAFSKFDSLLGYRNADRLRAKAKPSCGQRSLPPASG